MERHGRNGLGGLIFRLLSPFFSYALAQCIDEFESSRDPCHANGKFVCKAQAFMQSNDNLVRRKVSALRKTLFLAFPGLLVSTSVIDYVS